MMNLCFALFAGPSPSARELENNYAALFEPKQDIPFAFLVAIPITLLVVLLALFIRALEAAKRRCGAELVDKTDRNGDVVVFRDTSFNSNKESANQVLSCLVSNLKFSSPCIFRHNSVVLVGDYSLDNPLFPKPFVPLLSFNFAGDGMSIRGIIQYSWTHGRISYV